MRQLTAYASYLDNEGLPLVGRARFYNMDGSPAVVYSLDNAHNAYVQVGSVVFTDSSGKLDPQVFLADHDYTVVFDKYIGHGTMTEDNDSEAWDEQGSAVDRYNTLGIVLEGDSCRSISRISDLRDCPPAETESGQPEVILLLGYNQAGDKEPIYYYWDETSVETDNGGNVIKVNDVDTGRWRFIDCPRYLDVRHFGAFPLESSTPNTEQRYAIQRANAYTRWAGCGLYFGALGTAIYYDISGLNVYDVDSNPEARLFCANGMTASVIGIISVHCGGTTNGIIKLDDRIVRTSWGYEYQYARFEPVEKLVVDEPIDYGSTVTFQDIQVELVTNPGDDVVLKNCTITAVEAISGLITIEDCTLDTSWFIPSYDWDNLVSVGNRILVQNCKDASTYILLKNKQSETDYGDLMGQTATGCTLADNCNLENATLVNTTFEGSATLRNVHIQGTVTGTSLYGIVLDVTDGWFELDSTVTLAALRLRRGGLDGIGSLVMGSQLGNLRVENVHIALPVTIDCPNPQFIECTIDEDITQNAILDGGTGYWRLNGMYKGNVFNANLVLDTSDTGAFTTVDIAWLENHGNVVAPIDISGISSHVPATRQGYVYEGNTGGFLPTSIRYHQGSGITTSQMTKGWNATVTTKPDASVFIVGKRVVQATCNLAVHDAGWGTLGGSGTRVLEMTSGSLAGTDIFFPIMLPDMTTPVATDLIDEAPSGKFWVDLDVL